MALLEILNFPDPRLKKIAKPVAVVDERVRRIVKDMFETMYDAPGVGLAATQVDIHEQIIVIDVTEDHSDPLVLINPKLTWVSPELVECEEGCLSVPGVYDTVMRHAEVEVTALNEKGEQYTRKADGLLADCIQHEMDHLSGKVFVEYLSLLKQTRIKTKMKKRAEKR